MPNPHQIQLTPQQFHSRFLPLTQFSDPFGRQYFITRDTQTQKRTIYKHYLAEMNEQVDAIFDNIENYLKLNQLEGICKIVACVKLQQEQQVLAAFQYDDMSLGEYIQTTQFHTSRPHFYLQLLTSLTQTIRSMCEIGIDLDQLNYGNILIYKDQSNQNQMKVFYDEREKTYDKILEGYAFCCYMCRVKTFTSVEKLTALIGNDEEYFAEMMDLQDGISQENIYQLGSLMIDVMYVSETAQLPSSSQQFPRDRPVSRSNFINPQKSYYNIQDGCIVSLNSDYLDEKIRYLENDCSHIVRELVNVAKEMIKKREERIGLMELIGQIERVDKIWRDMTTKKVVRTVSNEGKKVVVENEAINSQSKQTISPNQKNGNQSSQDSHQNILNGLEQQSNFTEPNNHFINHQANYSPAKIQPNNPSHTSSHHQTVFSSYSSSSQKIPSPPQQNNLHDQKQKQKLRQATNSNTLSTTKQTITSKTTYVVNNDHSSPVFMSSNTLIQQHQKLSNNNVRVVSQTRISDSFADKPVKMIIPKQHILMNLKAHDSIKSSLQTLIKQIEALPQLRKKQYYDNSVYYGSISPQTNKRSGLGLYVYPSADVYFGTWSENQLVNGTYIFKNGESYEGSVKNGKQGWGRYRYSNGNVYEGEWKDDIKEGKGTMWYPNQDKYEGQWVKGKKNGFGKYFYNNGTIYEGNFMNGRKNGFGTILFPNGTRIQANWHQTHIQGEGKVHYPNGDFFHGEYSMSQKHGNGLYIWASDNTKYEGEFKKDTLQGEAKIYFTPNEYYFGRIRYGKRDGQGTYAYENGDSFTGEWKNDLKLIGHYVFKNGDQFQGKFKENQLNFGALKYANGEMYEGEFKNGYRHGVGSYRDRNGEVVCEGHWENDEFVSQGGH